MIDATDGDDGDDGDDASPNPNPDPDADPVLLPSLSLPPPAAASLLLLLVVLRAPRQSSKISNSLPTGVLVSTMRAAVTKKGGWCGAGVECRIM